MAKANLAERTYQDVPYSFQQLSSPFEVHGMDWHATQKGEDYDKSKGKVGVLVRKHVLMLYLQYLPTEACEPDAAENHCKSVELVVYQLVVLVNLKYEHKITGLRIL